MNEEPIHAIMGSSPLPPGDTAKHFAETVLRNARAAGAAGLPSYLTFVAW
jgi:hypothetical protein